MNTFISKLGEQEFLVVEVEDGLAVPINQIKKNDLKCNNGGCGNSVRIDLLDGEELYFVYENADAIRQCFKEARINKENE